MPRIEEHVAIEASASDVFRLCHDIDRRSDWDQRIPRAKLLTPGSIRRGSVIRFDTRPALGDVFSWDAEVVQYSFPTRSRLKVVDVAPSSSFVSGSETWRLNSSGGATRLTLVWEYEPRGLRGRVLDLLMRRRATRQAIRRSLQDLKHTLE